MISLELEAVKKDPAHLKPHVVFAPTATEFAQECGKNQESPAAYDSGERTGAGLQSTPSAPKAPGRVRSWMYRTTGPYDIVSTNWFDDQFFLSLEGFLTPSSLLLGDAGRRHAEGSQGSAARSLTHPERWSNS